MNKQRPEIEPCKGSVPIAWRPGKWLPSKFRATFTTREPSELTIVLDLVATKRGAPRVVALHYFVAPTGSISTSVVERTSIPTLVDMASRSAERPTKPAPKGSPAGGFTIDGDVETVYVSPWGRPKDPRLAQVAAAFTSGGYQGVADAFDVRVGSARNLVTAARKSGHLPPTANRAGRPSLTPAPSPWSDFTPTPFEAALGARLAEIDAHFETIGAVRQPDMPPYGSREES